MAGFTYELIPEEDWLLTVPRGESASKEEMLDYAMFLENHLQEHGYKAILNDHRGMPPPGDILGSVQRANHFKKNIGPKPSIPSALVVRPENLERARASETVFRNRGFTMKVFTDIDEARDWLRTILRPRT